MNHQPIAGLCGAGALGLFSDFCSSVVLVFCSETSSLGGSSFALVSVFSASFSVFSVSFSINSSEARGSVKCGNKSNCHGQMSSHPSQPMAPSQGKTHHYLR